MWERAQLGFGGTGRKRKGPCTKQCAWRKHGSCDTRLAEACPPKLWNTVKYSVEDMRPKWSFWKHRAPKMRLAEAQCAHRKHCYPETPLGSHPTSRVSQNVREPHMKTKGFETKRARKLTQTLPRTLPWNFITLGSFCASFFIFFPKIPPFWDLKSTLSSREKATCRGWVLGTVLERVAPQEKRKILCFWRARKGGYHTFRKILHPQK